MSRIELGPKEVEAGICTVSMCKRAGDVAERAQNISLDPNKIIEQLRKFGKKVTLKEGQAKVAKSTDVDSQSNANNRPNRTPESNSNEPSGGLVLLRRKRKKK